MSVLYGFGREAVRFCEPRSSDSLGRASMSWNRGAFLVASLALVAPSARADDPLPAGALTVLGSGATPQGQATFAGAFSPDGKLLALASQDRTIHLWDVRAGKEV